MPRDLKPGLYCPLPTFFDHNEEINYDNYKKHLLKLAKKGIVPVCGGALGEAVHLSFEERVGLVKFIRDSLDEAGLNDTPIVVGVSGSSTRKTIQMAEAAAKAGADAGLVILPGYYAASLEADQDQVIQYYQDVCEASPIPLFLYSFPDNSAGQDTASDVIETIMQRTKKLCGAQLTGGGGIGKLIRLTSALETNPGINASRPYPFLLLDGLVADLTPWMQSGGHGSVGGTINIAPAASVRLWTLLNKPDLSDNEKREAKRIQAILSKADAALVPAGIRGMKYILRKYSGYSSAPRRPLLPLKDVEGRELMRSIQEMFDLEAEMEYYA
ncbi:putative dihydrodipicolinate synthase [Xylariomycetidae sp. FL0641]|nr:putative dihydrodipicolinate synthase [Xylariomycetidae sp. FL0641]